MATQNHIHIDTSLTGSPEFSPTTKWKVLKRKPENQVYVNPNRGITGKLMVQALPNSGGTGPAQFMNYEYQLRIHSEDELATLLAMEGKEVYLVDNVHVNDGSDHTSYVRTMHLVKITGIENITPALEDYRVTLYLMDKDTIT